MKHLIDCLYLVTALGGFYWTGRLVLIGVYGVPVPFWTLAPFVGSVALLLGAIQCWTSGPGWARWLGLVGSLILSAFFLPASVGLWRRIPPRNPAGYAALAGGLGYTALVLISLVVALRSNMIALRRRG